MSMLTIADAPEGAFIEQGTPEWKQQRCGKVTASRVADVIAKTKTGWGAARANYMMELLAERLSGTPGEGYESPAMRWGKTCEEEARTAYEFYRDVSIVVAEFINHPTVPWSGASPDGYIGGDGLVEIKCPLTKTHITTLMTGAVPAEYAAQIQWQMACTGRAWCDYVSFDPRLPPEMQLFVKRVTRDATVIADLEEKVIEFLVELGNQIEELQARFQPEGTMSEGLG